MKISYIEKYCLGGDSEEQPAGYFVKGDAVTELINLREKWQGKLQMIYLDPFTGKLFLQAKDRKRRVEGQFQICIVPSGLF